MIGGAAALALSPVAAFGVASVTDSGVSSAPLAGNGSNGARRRRDRGA